MALATGIYVVALTGSSTATQVCSQTPPISETAVDELLAVRPELTLDRLHSETAKYPLSIFTGTRSGASAQER